MAYISFSFQEVLLCIYLSNNLQTFKNVLSFNFKKTPDLVIKAQAIFFLNFTTNNKSLEWNSILSSFISFN